MANDYHLSTLLTFGDVQALAVCEVDKNRRLHAKQRVEQAYGGKTAAKGCADYTDFRELIGRKDIDAVCIATPEHWHALAIIEAAKAGKDVYCEKPLTLTLAEAKHCIDVVRKNKRVLQTGSQQRSSVFGPFRQAAEIVRSGRLGTIRTVTVGVGGPSQWCDLPAEVMEPGLNWDLWLGPAPMRPYHSALRPSRRPQSFSGLAQLSRIRRRRPRRHGRPPLRHREVVPGHGRVGAGRNHSARRPQGDDGCEISLSQRRGYDPWWAQWLCLHRHRRDTSHRPRPSQQCSGEHREGTVG